MDGSCNIRVLMEDAYIHICDALDKLQEKERNFEGISIYNDHSGDIVIRGISLKLCKALFSILNELDRGCVFKSPRAIYSWLSCYHAKDYVRDSYLNGIGWFIAKPALTHRGSQYIIRHKVPNKSKKIIPTVSR